MHFVLRALRNHKFFLIGFAIGFLASLGTLSLNRVLSKEAFKQQKACEGTQKGANQKLN
ncbi:MAG: hypothetical protein ACO2PP_04285 [Thermocrinis sp.]|jgi:hypothetical protein|uniref:hypothetical protein n=1 Tax=Thermocrinis sp. TaxID=2024383 RepID=UPI003C09FDE0